MNSDKCSICGGTHPGFKHALVPIETQEYANQYRRLGPQAPNYCYVCNQYHPVNSFCPRMTVTCSGDINAIHDQRQA